ncbi:hypothetical protein [Kitasatospora sp. NPDC051914]|uniref:hypothetical protein n=1 Tax=Kitasatospora sp. NPDC051914 TaxID=3154945 RepID=UPI00341D726D
MRLYRKRPGGRRYYPVAPRVSVGISTALALVGGGVLVPALDWIGEGELDGGWFALGTYTALAAVLGAVSRAMAAPLIALACWLFFDGFAVHRHAEIGWDGGSDVLRLSLLVGAALATSLSGTLPRRRIRVRTITAPSRVRSSRR